MRTPHVFVAMVVMLAVSCVHGQGQPRLQLNTQPPAMMVAPPSSAAATAASPAAELGLGVAIPVEEKVIRLQKKVSELSQQVRALQKQMASIDSSLGTLARSAITYRCDNTGEPRSVNSLGASVTCTPYACDDTSGRCFQPLCARTDQCARGNSCDIGRTNLCTP